MHERGHAEGPDILDRVKARETEATALAPVVTPEPLQDYDLIVHPSAGAQSMGDPLERAPASVLEDLEKGWTRPRVAEAIHGVVAERNGSRDWTLDETGTRERRDAIRKQRLAQAVPFRQWWEEERKKVAAGENMDPAVLEMWRTSMELSPDYGDELRVFWNLPEDFVF